MTTELHFEGRKRNHAFSLLELLAVIGIVAIMMALISPATSSLVRRTSLEAEAKRLASLLRNARQYALENGTHTRVVFADAALEEFTEGRFKANEAYGAYAFFKPTLPSGGSDYKPISEGDEFSGEFASMPFTSIPSGFVGQFVPLPGSENWRILSPNVTMVGFIPEESDIDSEYSREFFSDSNVLAKPEDTSADPRSQRYVSKFFHNPSKFWDPDGATFYLANIPNSPYPQNYYQTPFPFAYPTITTRIMPDEPSNFEANGTTFTYKDLWVAQGELEYFTEIEEQTGNYKKCGEIDTKGPSEENKRFFDLKGIEFSPKGLPTLTWADEVAFQFRPKRGRRSPAFDVVISQNTGLANVRVTREPFTGAD